MSFQIEDTRPEIKAYSKGELCQLYNVSYHTLRQWLEPFKNIIGEYIGGNYTPKQVEIIFERLGYPG